MNMNLGDKPNEFIFCEDLNHRIGVLANTLKTCKCGKDDICRDIIEMHRKLIYSIEYISTKKSGENTSINEKIDVEKESFEKANKIEDIKNRVAELTKKTKESFKDCTSEKRKMLYLREVALRNIEVQQTNEGHSLLEEAINSGKKRDSSIWSLLMWLEKASLYMEYSGYADAENCIQEAGNLLNMNKGSEFYNPLLSVIYKIEGELLYRKREIAEALSRFSQIQAMLKDRKIKSNLLKPHIHLWKARCYRRLYDNKECLRELNCCEKYFNEENPRFFKKDLYLGEIERLKGVVDVQDDRAGDSYIHFDNALKHFRKIGHVPGQISTFTQMGKAHTIQGQYNEALFCFECGKTLWEESKKENEHISLSSLSDLILVNAEGSQFIDKPHITLESLKCSELEKAIINIHFARCNRLNGKINEAIKLLKKSKEAMKGKEANIYYLECIQELILAYIEKEEYAEAQDLYTTAVVPMEKPDKFGEVKHGINMIIKKILMIYEQLNKKEKITTRSDFNSIFSIIRNLKSSIDGISRYGHHRTTSNFGYKTIGKLVNRLYLQCDDATKKIAKDEIIKQYQDILSSFMDSGDIQSYMRTIKNYKKIDKLEAFYETSKLMMSNQEAELLFKRSDYEQFKDNYASILYLDIKKFTYLCRQDVRHVVSREELRRFISIFFGNLCKSARKNGGIIPSFLGDGAMIVFGSDSGMKTDPAHRALNVVKDIIVGADFIRRMNLFPNMKGEWNLYMTAAISSGNVNTGFFGDCNRLFYSSIGNPVNFSARLQQAANEIVDEGKWENGEFKNVSFTEYLGKKWCMLAICCDTCNSLYGENNRRIEVELRKGKFKNYYEGKPEQLLKEFPPIKKLTDEEIPYFKVSRIIK